MRSMSEIVMLTLFEIPHDQSSLDDTLVDLASDDSFLNLRISFAVVLHSQRLSALLQRELDAVHATVEEPPGIADGQKHSRIVSRRVVLAIGGNRTQTLAELLESLKAEVHVGHNGLRRAALEANHGGGAAMGDFHQIERHRRMDVLRPPPHLLTIGAALQHERDALHRPQHLLPQPEEVLQPDTAGLHVRDFQLDGEKRGFLGHDSLLMRLEKWRLADSTSPCGGAKGRGYFSRGGKARVGRRA